jgi:hypothetical protein
VNKVVEACLAFAITEQSPKLIGRVLGCMLAPKPVKAGSSGGGGGGGSGGGSAAQTQAAPKTEQPQVHAPKPAARADFDPLQI